MYSEPFAAGPDVSSNPWTHYLSTTSKKLYAGKYASVIPPEGLVGPRATALLVVPADTFSKSEEFGSSNDVFHVPTLFTCEVSTLRHVCLAQISAAENNNICSSWWGIFRVHLPPFSSYFRLVVIVVIFPFPNYYCRTDTMHSSSLLFLIGFHLWFFQLDNTVATDETPPLFFAQRTTTRGVVEI